MKKEESREQRYQETEYRLEGHKVLRLAHLLETLKEQAFNVKLIGHLGQGA